MSVDSSARAVVGIVYAVLGLSFGALGAAEGYNQYCLRHYGEVIIGKVTEKHTASSGGKRFDIRYQILVDGRPFTASDPLGRSNLWMALPPGAFLRIAVNDELSVRYLPSRPGINRPVAGPPTMRDSVAMVIAGGLALGLSFMAWRRSRHAPQEKVLP